MFELFNVDTINNAGRASGSFISFSCNYFTASLSRILIAACDADRTRNWMTREGGARAAFLDPSEAAPDSSSSLVCTWREHGLLYAIRHWIESQEVNEAAKNSQLTLVLSKGMTR